MSETRFKKLIVLAAVLGCAVCAAAAAVPELAILIFKLPCGFFVDLLWELAMTGEGWRIFAIALICARLPHPCGGAAPALEAAQALP